MSFRGVIVCSSALLLLVTVPAGCASSDEPTTTNGDPTSPSSPATPPASDAAATCTSPRTGLYLVDVTPKTSCPWWDSTRDGGDMNILEDSVGYPHSDDLCGDVQWSGCTLEDACGPLKISAGSQGWYGKGSLSITFTDDEHYVGTVTYDIGHACVMTLEVRGRYLDLGG